jgi:zinc-binding in reverse transcriptase
MIHEKSQIFSILHDLHFTQDNDLMVRIWEPTGFYTIKSSYNFLCFGRIKICLSKSVWSFKIPLKYILFFWMTLNNKILTKDNLYKCKWTGDHSCVFCSAPENVDHLFLKCPFVVDFWGHIINPHPQMGLLNTNSIFYF